MTRRALLHVVLPLVLGGALYLFLRRDDIALFDAVDALGLGRALDGARLVTHSCATLVPRPILGSAPDAAWAYAFGAALGLVWRGEMATRAARVWIGGGFAIALGIELAQSIHLIPGVFDPIDLAAIAVAYPVGACVTSWRSLSDRLLMAFR
jgi:hypothetical protein